jgi:hypothetical protein
MADESDDIDRQLSDVRTMGAKGLLRVAATSLANLVPVGGVLGSLLSEYASQRTTDKVCDIIEDLAQRLREHGEDPTKHLSKDEVVETVHQTLTYAAITSDADKLRFFKNGLAYTLIEGGPYGEKQILLDTLRNANAVELALLRELYVSADPYLSSEDGLLPNPRESYLVDPWEVAAEERGGNLHLGHLLAKRLGIQRGMVDAVARSLAGKGLAMMTSYLDDNYSVVVRRKAPGGMLASVARAPRPSNPRLTPVGQSRTDFGWRFVDFCNYEGPREPGI